jgi:hypothetical protein
MTAMIDSFQKREKNILRAETLFVTAGSIHNVTTVMTAQKGRA